MKIAILSDIHSNLEALKACVRKARRLGVERYCVLGDIVGYAADPVATLDMVMSLPGLVAVRGNHDEAVLNGNYPGVSKPIQKAIVWTNAQLTPQHLEFIDKLPYVQTLNNVMLAHASLYETSKWPYLIQPEQIKECMALAECPVLFLGHTHLPRLYYETALGIFKEIRPKDSHPIPLYRRQRYVINVGSVGQPRDGNSAAGFVVLDIATHEVSFYRVAYDFTSTARKILAADLAPHFAERLVDREWDL